MWPFGKSQKQKGFEAAKSALVQSKMALDGYMQDGRLVAAMLEDNYVLGYVMKRLFLATVFGCQMADLDERHATVLYENLVLPQFFKWEDVAAIAKRTAALTDDADSGRLFGKGADAATRMMNYRCGFKDVKTDPLYAAAVRYATAELDPKPGSEAAQALDRLVILSSLEDVTLGRHFIEHHGRPAEKGVLESIIRALDQVSR